MGIIATLFANKEKELYKESVEEFGKDNVTIIKVSGFFLFFNVVVPIVGYLLLMLGIFLVGGYLQSKVGISGLTIGVISIVSLCGIIFLVPILIDWIDYEMDFVLVTPNQVIYYNQSGLFNRVTEYLEADKIKTITYKKKGIIRTFFNIGELIFLAEGNDKQGEITFDWVLDPAKQAEHVMKIMETSSQLHK